MIALVCGKGYESADAWVALFASSFIFYNSYLILRPALGKIMDENVYEVLIIDIRKISLLVDGVIDTEKCNVRKTGISYHLDFHAIVYGDITIRGGHEIAHRLKDTLQLELPQVKYIMVYVEPNDLEAAKGYNDVK